MRAALVHCRAPEKAFETLRVDFPPPPPLSAPPPPSLPSPPPPPSKLLASLFSKQRFGSSFDPTPRSFPNSVTVENGSAASQPQCSLSLACFGGFSNVYFVLLSLAVRSSGALSTLFFSIFLLLYCAAPPSPPRLLAVAGFCAAAAAAVHHGALTDSECWDPNSFYFGTTLGVPSCYCVEF